jgi:hypothetical protein
MRRLSILREQGQGGSTFPCGGSMESVTIAPLGVVMLFLTQRTEAGPVRRGDAREGHALAARAAFPQLLTSALTEARRSL